ncbi:hypothetical protein [Thermomonospora umbrina]|nr:hypothetical protein [Thermomonospora umbrina]
MAAVDTVLVGGRVVRRNGRLPHHDVRAVLERLAGTARHVTAVA